MKKLIFLFGIAILLIPFKSSALYNVVGNYIRTDIQPTSPSGTVKITITCGLDATQVCYTLTAPPCPALLPYNFPADLDDGHPQKQACLLNKQVSVFDGTNTFSGTMTNIDITSGTYLGQSVYYSDLYIYNAP